VLARNGEGERESLCAREDDREGGKDKESKREREIERGRKRERAEREKGRERRGRGRGCVRATPCERK